MSEQIRPCPECRAGKCGNCSGETWDIRYDCPAPCPCQHEVKTPEWVLLLDYAVCAMTTADAFHAAYDAVIKREDDVVPPICGKPIAYVLRSKHGSVAGACVEHTAWIRANQADLLESVETA